MPRRLTRASAAPAPASAAARFASDSDDVPRQLPDLSGVCRAASDRGNGTPSSEPGSVCGLGARSRGFARLAARAAASGATGAFVASKELVAALRDQRLGLWDSMAEENRAQAALCDTDDYREGFAAFQEKRKPVFTGRG